MIRAKSAKRKSTTVLLEGSKKRCSSVQQTSTSHFKPLQDATPNSPSPKRRYIETTPYGDAAKIRPDLPTPPFSEGSPSKPSAIPVPTIPLPHLNFAPNDKVWSGLKRQEEKRHKNKIGILTHVLYGPCKRAKLLDWLVVVCQQFHLKRETYYLAMDYTDRFFSKRSDSSWRPEQIQLVGVTALHMAAKLEEIYPPGCEHFAETTCVFTAVDVCQMELTIMKALDWRLSTLTVNTWLNLFLQINHFRGLSCTTLQFMKPEYSQSDFVKIIQLIDLCTLDANSVQFRPSIIAASALWLILPNQLQEVTGYTWEDLIAARNWMQPYAKTLKSYPAQQVRSFTGIEERDRHNIQTHFNVGLRLLAEVWKAQDEDEPLTPESDSDVENEEVTRYMATPTSNSAAPDASPKSRHNLPETPSSSSSSSHR